MLAKIKNNSFIKAIRKKRFEKMFSNHRDVNYFRGVFASFDEASASAPHTKPTGYNNSDSAKMYKERISRLHSTDYPVLFWMEKIKNNFSKVFDFGGHVGIHYYSYPKVLDFSNLVQWTVCDVEKVCQEGEEIASLNDPLGKLHFETDIRKCDGHDLLLANGSLQYLEWELHEKLKLLTNKPRYIIVNMTPLHPQTKTITLNNIGTAFCPYHLRKEIDFFNGLKEIGYNVIDTWSNEEKKCNIAFESERSLKYYRGAILEILNLNISPPATTLNAEIPTK